MYALKPGFLGTACKDDDLIEIAAVNMYNDMDVESLFERVGAGLDSMSDAVRYPDSEPHHFHGDIVITDPCYFGIDNFWNLGFNAERLHLARYALRRLVMPCLRHEYRQYHRSVLC